MLKSRSWPGKSQPLGATLTPEGVNFALFSRHATGVDLCLFNPEDPNREERIRMVERTDQVWHAFVPGLKAGQLYGYRVYGPYDPNNGYRFNPSKLLVDPYARAIAGDIKWGDEMFPYVLGNPEEDLARDFRNNAAGMPKSVVVDTSFDWGNDQRPRTPLAESIIYEAHVKGFTKLLETIPENLRGTYAGLATPEAIDYLTSLGITAIELLPIHHFVHDKVLVDRGLVNYWGYNSLGYFAPHSGYSSAGVLGQQIFEFKQMVKALHSAGIEVFLDVVYNHTCEGNHHGPTFSFRGIDNISYYRLMKDDRRYYMDYTGCGNTLDPKHPRILQLVMDSLRYWVEEMRIDGFRFDLAPALAREDHEVDPRGAFFDIIMQDPVISRVKLIAEPWDLGENGYQLGNFPNLWSEWNGKFRDTVRGFWKGDEGTVSELAPCLTGSSHLYEADDRRPYASINFITAHDGFTLNDLVSYNEKRNEANGEENNDGTDHNISWNCGAEGPTDDPEINKLRRRQRRNFLATLLLSQGVPMICAGDEYGRSQEGNNNAYCQDNELTWIRWNRNEEENQLTDYTRKLIELRRKHPVFRRTKFLHGKRVRGSQFKEVTWFNPSGKEMRDEEWNQPGPNVLGALFLGKTTTIRDERGNPMLDDTFLLLLNAHHEEIRFALPGSEDLRWEWILNTALEEGFPENPEIFQAKESIELMQRSFSLLKLVESQKE